jgi:exodeoxyribonuclease VII small subunit
MNEIIRALERGETPLDDSIKLFEEGAKLAGHCQALLTKAEQKVTKLVKNGENVEEEPCELL